MGTASIPSQVFQVTGALQNQSDSGQGGQLAKGLEQVVDINGSVTPENPGGVVIESCVMGRATDCQYLDMDGPITLLINLDALDVMSQLVKSCVLPVSGPAIAKGLVIAGDSAISLKYGALAEYFLAVIHQGSQGALCATEFGDKLVALDRNGIALLCH